MVTEQEGGGETCVVSCRQTERSLLLAESLPKRKEGGRRKRVRGLSVVQQRGRCVRVVGVWCAVCRCVVHSREGGNHITMGNWGKDTLSHNKSANGGAGVCAARCGISRLPPPVCMEELSVG